MDGVRVSVVGAPGKGIQQEVLDAMRHATLLEAIDVQWQQAGRGVTLEVLIKERESERVTGQLWSEIGKDLSPRLLELGGSFALYLDTDDIEPQTVLRWVRSATSESQRTVADLAVSSRPHPAGLNWNVETVRCLLVQSSRAPNAGSWLGSLWTDTGPGNFFFTDVAQVVYEGNMAKKLERQSSLGEEEFVGRLGEVTAWLIPHGDPPLFLVGLPPESDLYRELVAPG